MWLTESNRLKHFTYAIPCALFGTIVLVIGMAIGLEFKDKEYSNKWDWLDLIATILGGLVGQVLQIGFISLLV